MSIQLNPITLKSWAGFSEKLSKWTTDEADHYKTLGISEADLEFLASMSLEGSKGVYFLMITLSQPIIDADEEMVGFVVGHMTPRLDVKNGGFVSHQDFFVRALFISKSAPRQTSELADSIVCGHLKALGVSRIYGHCKFELATAKNGRLGYTAKYAVMEKNLNG